MDQGVIEAAMDGANDGQEANDESGSYRGIDGRRSIEGAINVTENSIEVAMDVKSDGTGSNRSKVRWYKGWIRVNQMSEE